MTIKSPCKTCKGEGLVDGLGESTLVIPRGSSYGDTITIKEKGNDSHNGKSGDLKISLKVMGSRDPKDKRFKATGRNVWSDKVNEKELDEFGELVMNQTEDDAEGDVTVNGYSKERNWESNNPHSVNGSGDREFRLDGRDIHSLEQLNVWEVEQI